MGIAAFHRKTKGSHKSKNVPSRILVVGLLFCLFLPVTPFLFSPSNATPENLQSSTPSNGLSNHWLASRGCYRDEINQSDVDYNNCWMDNAGKILVASAITGDATDLDQSLHFIENYLKPGSSGYYLPELSVINGSISPPVYENSSTISISNGLVELAADNATSSRFNQLAIGTSYTGDTNLAYIGGDRIWYCTVLPCLQNESYALSSNSSSVFLIPNGFSERSLFQTEGNSYYVYVNATLAPSEPYANVSIQLEAIGSSSAKFVEYLYLQAFNTTSTNPFYSGSLYSPDGAYIRSLPYRNSSGIGAGSGGGVLLSYSNATNVFSNVRSDGNATGQDAVAIRFGNGSIYDWEHWAEDPPFSHSWFGPGYHAPQAPANSLSAPIYSVVYPILHFDYHLANDTMKYIASGPPGVAVSSPVSFGFVSYGLALDSSMNPDNSILRALARGYWNYYYVRYADSSDYGTPYARSVNLLALAGFKLYGCNSTVESFARDFIGNTSGSGVEEYGWGTAALYALESCSGSEGDSSLYRSFVNSFGISMTHFIQISDNARGRTELEPNSTFGFGEAASGLMLGGVPYNNSTVIRTMDAVYQSNVSGTLLNQPYHGDLANTETIPAFTLSTWLFQSEMRNAAGYWITSISNANVTSIDLSANASLTLSVFGENGSVSLIGTSSQVQTISGINGSRVFQIASRPSTSSVTFTSSSSSVPVTAAASSSTRASCVGRGIPPWTYTLAGVAVVLAILFSVFGYYLVSRGRKRGSGDL